MMIRVVAEIEEGVDGRGCRKQEWRGRVMIGGKRRNTVRVSADRKNAEGSWRLLVEVLTVTTMGRLGAEACSGSVGSMQC